MSQSLTKQDRKVIRVLRKLDLHTPHKIADTLQGSIWRAYKSTDGESTESKPQSVVIKITNQYLSQNQLAKVGKDTIRVQENILLESSILKFLTENPKCPPSIVRFQNFFKTSKDYYMVMEDGGYSLFDFIQNAHDMIKKGRLQITHWRQVVKAIAYQIVECIEYIHSKNVCHYDISLENFLINDVAVEVEEFGDIENIKFVTDDIQIKLCDFGLAKLFTKSECLSDKYCGKRNYKSPEVIARKKKFNAKMNDIWCIGVSLFMMMTGSRPWHVAKDGDETYMLMMNGYMRRLLKAWDRLDYVDDDLIDLFQAIFKTEEKRIGITEIKMHPWFSKLEA